VLDKYDRFWRRRRSHRGGAPPCSRSGAKRQQNRPVALCQVNHKFRFCCRFAADRRQAGLLRLWQKRGNGRHRGFYKRQTARRGARAPLQVILVACSFLFLGGLLLFLVARPFLLFERPPSGVKSKRIFLSADAALILRFIRYGSDLKVVLLFSARSRSLSLTKRSTPKKSVSCVSVRLVLVMSEPIRLVFIGLLRFFIFVVRKT